MNVNFPKIIESNYYNGESLEVNETIFGKIKDGRNKPVTLNINANNATKRLAIVIWTLKYSAISGIIPGMLKNVDSEKTIRNKLKVIFFNISYLPLKLKGSNIIIT